MDINSRPIGMVRRANEGLRSFLNRVYNYMAGGLVLSGITAYLTTQEPLLSMMYTVKNGMYTYSGLGWIAILSPLLLIFIMNNAVQNANVKLANLLFWAFSALLGVSLSNVFMLYTGDSIAQMFLVTAGSFLALSIYGHSTKRDVSGWSSFLIMGLVGLIVASLINLFFKSSQAAFVMSVIGVFLFAGFTIYDTNRLKAMYEQTQTAEQQKSLAIYGALALYLDFINLFRFLLELFGDRK